MAGHIDLRNHLNVFGVRVGDYLADILLRIKPGMGAKAEIRVGAFGAKLRQARVFFNFHAPALILRQMPVENVELMHRHEI